MKKLHAWIVAFGMSWAAAVHADTTLEVAVFPALDQIVNAALPAWNAAHPDVKIKLVTRSYEEHHRTMLSSMTDDDFRVDVMAVEIDYLRHFAKSEGLENLAKIPYKGLLYRKKFVDYTFPLAASVRGELIAMPTDIATGTMFYRRDVLDKAGVTEAELTNSWESYVEAGKKIKAATGAYIAARALDVANVVLRSNMKEGEGLYFDKDNNPLVESPRFVRAFEIAKAVRDAKLDANLKQWSPEWTKAFQRGAIATHTGGVWFGGYLSNTISPKSSGLWRVADIPANTYIQMGGTYYAIPKRSKNKEMAWEFVKFMTIDKSSQLNAFKLQNAFPALLEAQVTPFFNEPVEFFGGQKARVLWRNAARRTLFFKVNEHDNVAHDIVEAELEKVLESGKDIPTALKDAKATIEKRITPESRPRTE